MSISVRDSPFQPLRLRFWSLELQSLQPKHANDDPSLALTPDIPSYQHFAPTTLNIEYMAYLMLIRNEGEVASQNRGTPI